MLHQYFMTVWNKKHIFLLNVLYVNNFRSFFFLRYRLYHMILNPLAVQLHYTIETDKLPEKKLHSFFIYNDIILKKQKKKTTTLFKTTSRVSRRVGGLVTS